MTVSDYRVRAASLRGSEKIRDLAEMQFVSCERLERRCQARGGSGSGGAARGLGAAMATTGAYLVLVAHAALQLAQSVVDLQTLEGVGLGSSTQSVQCRGGLRIQ